MFSGFFQCVEMKKKYSLKRNEEIAQIVHKHRLKSDDCFTIYYQNNENNQHSRVCISVSKKNGNAVIRNILYYFPWTTYCIYTIYLY